MIIQKSIKLAMEVFEQKMEDFADKVTVKELTADLAMDFSATLKDAFSEAGRKAYQRFIEFHDINEAKLESTADTPSEDGQSQDLSDTLWLIPIAALCIKLMPEESLIVLWIIFGA